MSHLDAAILHELVDGEIPSSDLGPITAHLASCAACRANLDEARMLVADVDELIETIEVPPLATVPRHQTVSSRRPRWIGGLAWAATMILAVGLGYAVRDRQEPAPALVVSPPPQERTAVPKPAESVPIAAVPPAAPATTQRAPAPHPAPRSAASSQVTEPSAPAANAAPSAADRRSDIAAQKSAARVDSVARMAQGVVAASEQVRAPLVANGAGGGRGGRGMLDTSRAARMNRSVAPSAPSLPTRIDTIALPDAMRRLGGTIRLIEGLVPLRLEAQGAVVRVVYPGDLVLQQQLIDGRVVFDLIAPRGFPGDSLAKLRGKVRE